MGAMPEFDAGAELTLAKAHLCYLMAQVEHCRSLIGRLEAAVAEDNQLELLYEGFDVLVPDEEPPISDEELVRVTSRASHPGF